MGAVVSARELVAWVTPQPTSRTGLVGEWGFNEGAGSVVSDSSGQGNTGTLGGATWAGGFYGGGLLFNGVNSWVTVNDSASLDLTTGMTLEAGRYSTRTVTDDGSTEVATALRQPG